MTAKKTQLVAPHAPRLPSPLDAYSADQLDQLNNALKSYFNQIDTAQSTLLGPTGARFLDFPYAVLYHAADQTSASTTAINAVMFPTEQEGTGVSVVANTQLKVTFPGLYALSFLAQLKNVDAASQDVYFWLRKNGVDVSNTAHRITAVVGYSRPSIGFTLQLEESDYVELMWNTTSTNVSLSFTAAQTTPVVIPAIPSASVAIQFNSAVNSSSLDVPVVPPAPPAPAPTPPPPPPAPGPAPTPAPPPAPLGTDADTQAIFTTLGAGSRAWWYPENGPDRVELSDGTGSTGIAAPNPYGRLVDHSGNGFHLNWPTLDQRPLATDVGTHTVLQTYSHPDTVALGGSTTGFTAVFAAEFRSGTYTTLFSDVTGAAATAHNGTYLRFNGDTGELTFSVGNGTTRVSVAQGGILTDAGALPYVIAVRFDDTANLIKIKVNDNAEVTASCSTISAGSSAMQVFSNPFADFSLGGWEGWDQLYGYCFGGFIFKNTTLSDTDLNTLRFWLGTQCDVTLSGSTPAAPPPPPPPAPAPPPPPPPSVPTISTISRHPFDWLKIGNYLVTDGLENTIPIPEGAASFQYAQQSERSLTVGSNGEVAARWVWRWPQFKADGTEYDHVNNEIKSFPAIMYGAPPGDISSAFPAYPADTYALRLPDGATVATPPGSAPPQATADWVTVGGSVSTVTPAGNSGGVLPLQQPLSQLKSQFRYNKNVEPTGVGHMSFDIWLTEGGTQSVGFRNSKITHEIMVPIINWGGYGNIHTIPGPWSRDPANYSHDVAIGGVVYKVYVFQNRPGAPGLQYNFQAGVLTGARINEETGLPATGWKFIVYDPIDLATTGHPKDATGLVTVNIAAILADIRAHSDSRGTRWSRGTEFVAAVELGVETVYTAGDITVYDYSVTTTASPPAPAPAPAPVSALPSRVLGCYFLEWDFSTNITQVPLDFNVIYIFNAQPLGPLAPDGSRNNVGDGTFWLPDIGAPHISKASIQTVRARGQRVILTCGGAGAGFDFNTRTKSNNFIASFQGMYTAMGGLDGIDFNNYEAGINITSSEMIYIAQQLRLLYGSSFIITSPPGAFNTGGAAVAGIASGSGASLNLMSAMLAAGVLDYAGPQFYDWSFYKQSGVVKQITDQWVAALGATHVVVGLSANYNFANALTLPECQRELTTVLAAYPTIKGSFCWNAQSNISGGNAWGSTIAAQISATAAPPPPPPPAPPGGAPFYPFGFRLDLTGGTAYPHGIMPTNLTAAQMDGRVTAAYELWKSARLKTAPTFVASAGAALGLAGTTITDGLYNLFNDPVVAYVSEGQGYAMLITVIMAGYDPDAQTLFNRLFKTARARPAYAMGTVAARQYCMDWRILTDMSSGGEGFSAPDGDLDMALALLMADRQWGSAGTYNYLAEGINTLNALKGFYFTGLGSPKSPQNVSRTSDYMAGHFRSFKHATADATWDTIRTRCGTLATNVTASFSPTAHLQPGFIFDPDGTPVPDTVVHLDGSGIEGDYDDNAVRNPWRWGTDYIWSGDATWGNLAGGNTSFIKSDSGSNPSNTAQFYHLNGVGFDGRFLAVEPVAGSMVGAMTSATHQAYLNACFTALSDNYDSRYFVAELALFALIVASGNWWRPEGP